MLIRKILLAMPVVLILLFVGAFLLARPYFGDRQAQLTIQSIGEPERLSIGRGGRPELDLVIVPARGLKSLAPVSLARR